MLTGIAEKTTVPVAFTLNVETRVSPPNWAAHPADFGNERINGPPA
jgi:hypothetical protein